ncbi:MAG: ATP-binding protein [Chlamydiae bacterium]|nr:ATP-binding protein [Chlamydiota bacterium]
MVFLSGPRQVGKTTCSQLLEKDHPDFHYLNWEVAEHRKLIITGPQTVGNHLNLDSLGSSKPLIIFDEIHKFGKWKLFLKGFFDLYEKKCQIIVTGSAKLSVYQRGGDSLMGRYFPYRVHPLSVGELLRPNTRADEILPPKKPKDLNRLFEYGGFPEPFTRKDLKFSNSWSRLRREQLMQDDIRQLSQIQDIAEMEILLDLLADEAGQLLNASSFANQINMASNTITRWVKTLESFYYCFLVKPWSKNVRRSLRKTPKCYLWDWSMVKDHGQRVENFIASHLLKSVHYWTDCGFGSYDLHYLRDNNKNEVDFLVTKDKKPWFLVEAKATKNKGISKSLYYFQKELDVPHAFQVVFDMPYVEADCFLEHEPVIVPAATFLSQLL